MIIEIHHSRFMIAIHRGDRVDQCCIVLRSFIRQCILDIGQRGIAAENYITDAERIRIVQLISRNTLDLNIGIPVVVSLCVVGDLFITGTDAQMDIADIGIGILFNKVEAQRRFTVQQYGVAVVGKPSAFELCDYTAHLYDGSYLHMLYGNMLRDGLAEPMIIVGVDMYTGKQSVKDDLDGYGLRAAYDKTVDDIAVDLMPFIRENFAVAEGRENTAVAGVSEGGAKSLCTGFQRFDRIGYIAGIAPDGNVIAVNGYYSDISMTM